jgi:hypothetical protein
MAVDAKRLAERMNRQADGYEKMWGTEDVSLRLLAEAVELMPHISHANYCPEAHQGGKCDCGTDQRADWLRRVAEAHAEEGGDDE